jgi:hypothetical protein
MSDFDSRAHVSQLLEALGVNPGAKLVHGSVQYV